MPICASVVIFLQAPLEFPKYSICISQRAESQKLVCTAVHLTPVVHSRTLKTYNKKIENNAVQHKLLFHGGWQATFDEY